MDTLKPDPLQTATALYFNRYSQAQVALLAGSAAAGELTPYSDLDFIVLFDKLPHAYRESFIFDGWAVEAFVHDMETLKYFFRIDTAVGDPVSLRMVAEGVAVPRANALSRSLKEFALNLLSAGPAPLNDSEERRMRYMITSMTTDLRHPRSKSETTATGAALYELIAGYYLRTRGRWSASGKMVPRRLHEADAEFCAEFGAAFDELFAARPERLRGMVEDLLAPRGGLLFDGYRFDAPNNWRVPITGES